MARKTCWLAYCKIRPNVVAHPVTSGMWHFTYYILGHTKSFSGILNTKVVWVLEYRISISQYLVCEMQYARSTRTFCCIWSDFTECKPACFSGHSDPQSSAQWKICHIHHVVSLGYKQNWDRWQMIDRMISATMTAHLSVSSIEILQLLCTVNVFINYCCTKQSK